MFHSNEVLTFSYLFQFGALNSPERRRESGGKEDDTISQQDGFGSGPDDYHVIDDHSDVSDFSCVLFLFFC